MASMDDCPRKSGKLMVDRISSLPDEVLSHILSLVPTKCAVGTSILSNRWKYLWTCITSFDLKGPCTNNNISEIVDFTYFVDNLFRSCTSSQIQKFSLHVDWDDKTRVENWVNEAVKRNAKEVDIAVKKLPPLCSIFSCKTVSVLKLSVPANCYNDANTTVSFDLPCLKLLHLNLEGYGNFLLKELIRSCSVLEDLTLAGNLIDKNFMVSSFVLKILRLQPNNRTRKPVKLSVHAPALEYLHMDKVSVKHIFTGDFSSLLKASLNITSISCCWLKDGVPRSFTLPTFHNLAYLEVVTFDHRFCAALPRLLSCSPCLEALFLDQRDDRMLHYSGLWVKPKTIPNCFGFRLADIKIKGFKGRGHELQLIEYCLGNTKVLKSLSIDCKGLTQVEETLFHGQLLEFSRASTSSHSVPW